MRYHCHLPLLVDDQLKNKCSNTERIPKMKLIIGEGREEFKQRPNKSKKGPLWERFTLSSL